jgi:hypothetical protein
MRIVRFLKNDLPYLQGEIAGFPDHIASKLIEKGFAVLHGDGKPKQTGTRIPDPFGYSSGFSDPSKNFTK